MTYHLRYSAIYWRVVFARLYVAQRGREIIAWRAGLRSIIRWLICHYYRVPFIDITIDDDGIVGEAVIFPNIIVGGILPYALRAAAQRISLHSIVIYYYSDWLLLMTIQFPRLLLLCGGKEGQETVLNRKALLFCTIDMIDWLLNTTPLLLTPVTSPYALCHWPSHIVIVPEPDDVWP